MQHVPQHHVGQADDTGDDAAGEVDGEEFTPVDLLMQRRTDDPQQEHVRCDMAELLVAEDVAEVAQRANDGGGGDEVAVEQPPGGRKVPQAEEGEVDGYDAKDGRVADGLRSHHPRRLIWRGPCYSIDVRRQGYGGGEEEGREKASELRFV